MTIAAGFVYGGGVLLCADTELSAWAMKIQASKMRVFSCPGGKCVMAYAGNSAFALSAMQKCERQLNSVPQQDTFSALERILDKEYRRTVLSHPAHATDGNLPYNLLIGFCPPGGPAELYVTQQTSIRSIDTYECIGIGDILAHYLIRPNYVFNMGERRMLSWATYALSAAKDYIQGCGGISQFVALRNDGSIGRTASVKEAGHEPQTSIEWLDKIVPEVDYHSRRLLMDLANPDHTEEQFEICLERFIRATRDLRTEFRQANLTHEAFATVVTTK